MIFVLIVMTWPLVDLAWLHTNMVDSFVGAILFDCETLRQQPLWRLILEGIILQQVNIEDLLFLAHHAHGLTLRDFPLIDLTEVAASLRLVRFLNDIEQVVGVAQEKQELVWHQVRYVVPLVLFLFKEVLKQFVLAVRLSASIKIAFVLLTDEVLDHVPFAIVPLEIGYDVVEPHLAELVRDAHVDQTESPLYLVVHYVEVVLLGLAALKLERIDTLADLLNRQPTFLDDGQRRRNQLDICKCFAPRNETWTCLQETVTVKRLNNILEVDLARPLDVIFGA